MFLKKNQKRVLVLSTFILMIVAREKANRIGKSLEIDLI